MSTAAQYEALRAAHPPGPRWAMKAFCERNPRTCENNTDIVLLMHADRGPDILDLMSSADCDVLMGE